MGKIRVRVESDLIDETKKLYPEIAGLDPKDVVDWGLRKVNEAKEA